MKVILTSDIEDIGLEGELKTVSNGLARNYLIPHKLAIEATDSNLRDLEKKLEKLKQKREKIIADAHAFAEKVEGKLVSIESKVSDGEKMFGSVDARTIADAFMEQHGIEIERRNILLEKNIKSIGRFEVPVRVKAHIKTSITVEITAEQNEEEISEAEEEARQEAAGREADSEESSPEMPEAEDKEVEKTPELDRKMTVKY